VVSSAAATSSPSAIVYSSTTRKKRKRKYQREEVIKEAPRKKRREKEEEKGEKSSLIGHSNETSPLILPECTITLPEEGELEYLKKELYKRKLAPYSPISDDKDIIIEDIERLLPSKKRGGGQGPESTWLSSGVSLQL
jgi:hypothetical protein